MEAVAVEADSEEVVEVVGDKTLSLLKIRPVNVSQVPNIRIFRLAMCLNFVECISDGVGVLSSVTTRHLARGRMSTLPSLQRIIANEPVTTSAKTT